MGVVVLVIVIGAAGLALAAFLAHRTMSKASRFNPRAKRPDSADASAFYYGATGSDAGDRVGSDTSQPFEFGGGESGGAGASGSWDDSGGTGADAADAGGGDSGGGGGGDGGGGGGD